MTITQPDLHYNLEGQRSRSFQYTRRIYVSTEKPSKNFKLVIQYIMQVYVPLWFAIKFQSSIARAAFHVFEAVRRCRTLPQEVQDIVLPVVERNAYGAHVESILCSMIADEQKPAYQELAWRRILRCREERVPSQRVRTFRTPSLNFNATSYIQLIDWSSIHISEPVFTKCIETATIKEIIQNRQFNSNVIPNLPCHTQAVERHIKIVTEASAAVVGHENREGYIFNRIKSRQSMPSFNTKKEYKSVH